MQSYADFFHAKHSPSTNFRMPFYYTCSTSSLTYLIPVLPHGLLNTTGNYVMSKTLNWGYIVYAV